MQRRRVLVASGALAAVALSVASGGCRPVQQSATAAVSQTSDLRKVAGDLQAKTTALVDAINSRNDANIRKAQEELQKAADAAEDAVKSETGTVANQINTAVSFIRSAVLTNNVPQLERAKALLQQAAGS